MKRILTYTVLAAITLLNGPVMSQDWSSPWKAYGQIFDTSEKKVLIVSGSQGLEKELPDAPLFFSTKLTPVPGSTAEEQAETLGFERLEEYTESAKRCIRLFAHVNPAQSALASCQSDIALQDLGVENVGFDCVRAVQSRHRLEAEERLLEATQSEDRFPLISVDDHVDVTMYRQTFGEVWTSNRCEEIRRHEALLEHLGPKPRESRSARPADPHKMFQVGQRHYEKGRYAHARRDWEAVLQTPDLNVNYPDLYVRANTTLAFLRIRHYPQLELGLTAPDLIKAVQHWTAAADHPERLFDACSRRAGTKQQVKDCLSARTELERKTRGDRAEALFYLCESHADEEFSARDVQQGIERCRAAETAIGAGGHSEDVRTRMENRRSINLGVLLLERRFQ